MIHKTYNYQLSLFTSLTQTKMKDYQSKFRGFWSLGGEEIGQDKETEKKKDVDEKRAGRLLTK